MRAEKLKANGSYIHEDGAMDNESEPTGIPKEWDLGGSKGGIDSDGHENEKVGMVRGREKKQKTSDRCRHEVLSS